MTTKNTTRHQLGTQGLRVLAAGLMASILLALDAAGAGLSAEKPGVVATASASTADVAPATTETTRSARRARAGSCRRAPRYTASTTRFGVSVSTSRMNLEESLRHQERTFGRLRAVRTYDPTIPPDGAWQRRRETLKGRTVVTSFRMSPQAVLAGRYDRQLRRYFREAPRRQPILWSYIHEPEPLIVQGQFTARQYRRAFRRVVNIARRFCRTNLYPTLILTGWTADPASGRRWRRYYPGQKFISVLAWDPYNSASRTPTRYQRPSRLYRHVVRASRRAGSPWGIAETGSMLVPGDDGTRRAAWLHRVGRYFNRKGAGFVTYFQSTRDGDFELRDADSITAWRRWVAR